MGKEIETILGLDQGTSSSKALLITSNGVPIEGFAESVAPVRHDGEYLVQDAAELLNTLCSVRDKAISYAKAKKFKISGVGLTCQRSSVLAWDENEILCPMLSWMDISQSERIKNLSLIHREAIYEKTFLFPSPGYPASKIAFLQEKFPARDIKIATLDVFLKEKLFSCEYLIDESIAARTLLYDLDSRSWDEELCGIFNVSKQRLPTVKACISNFGINEGVNLLCSVGDSQASLMSALYDGFDGSISLGTIASFSRRTLRGELPRRGFAGSLLYSTDDTATFLIEGVSHASGRLLDQTLSEYSLSNLEVSQTNIRETRNSFEFPVAFIPFEGTGSPEWDFEAKPLYKRWDGLTEEIKLGAVLENIAFFVVANIEALGGEKERYLLCGGVAKSSIIQECLSALLEQEILLSNDDSYQAARGAAIGVLWNKGLLPKVEKIEPDILQIKKTENAAAIRSRYLEWKELRKRATA